MVMKRMERGEQINGLITASAGNHAQGVSLVAKKLLLPCSVVCPEWAPETKLSAVRQYGAGALAACLVLFFTCYILLSQFVLFLFCFVLFYFTPRCTCLG